MTREACANAANEKFIKVKTLIESIVDQSISKSVSSYLQIFFFFFEMSHSCERSSLFIYSHNMYCNLNELLTHASSMYLGEIVSYNNLSFKITFQKGNKMMPKLHVQRDQCRIPLQDITPMKL